MRPTTVLVAVVVTVFTVWATLRYGPIGAVVSCGGFAAGYGIGLVAERVTGRWPLDQGDP